MGTLVSSLLVIVASVLAIPVMVFFLEILAATVLTRSQRAVWSNNGVRKFVTVLVPAHDESLGLPATLENIKSQSLPGDRLLVVADNCLDDTAAVARAAGAEVIERNDVTKKGKGYALDWAIRHLGADPPEIVIIIDADCSLADGAIDRLASTCERTGRPVQALYLMTAPIESQINQRVAEFSWRVKNWLRPLGLSAINLPCQLMGTGMAFPWNVLHSAELDNGHIVEDLKLGLDLTLAGHPPVFCPSARVMSEFPSSVLGVRTQRKRWEHGHLEAIVKTAPRLLTIAIAHGDWDLLAIALDVLVPPLSLLAILVLGIFGFSFIYTVAGNSPVALAINTASLLFYAIATLLAWLKCGRDVISPGVLLLLPVYAFRKLKLYRQFIFGKIDSQWIRTDRTK
jgi:cellulose synthase/poly-beta-1,6-N-acetylglucosamine synthase-like glycosyltransferase